MKIRVDSKADALYVKLDDSKIVESEEVSPGVILDYNEQQQVVGVGNAEPIFSVPAS